MEKQYLKKHNRSKYINLGNQFQLQHSECYDGKWNINFAYISVPMFTYVHRSVDHRWTLSLNHVQCCDLSKGISGKGSKY